MASRPEQENAATDDEEMRLLNEDDSGEKPKNGRKNQDTDLSGVSSWLKNNFKLFVAVLTIVSLVALGIVVGAVSNKHSKNRLARLARNQFEYAGIRLPKDIEPLRYRIYLHPNLTTFKVFGSTRILMRCVKATSKVILHFKDNTIMQVRLLKGSYLSKPLNEKDVLAKDSYLTNSDKELLMVQTEQDLEVGQNYTLIIRYNGTLQAKLQGFYRSSYKTKSGETRYIATSHFESSAARTAFPCFDEPAMKATFRIIIVRESRHKADSNMPKLATKPRHDGLLVDHFQESVKMCTYLVAFVIHDFESIASKSKRGVKIRIIAPADQISQATFASETAPKVLDYYESFFKINFPLEKLDLIAIPDFGPGAMENWGLITYRMTSLLYDKDESSDSNKQWVAVVIAHEIAHQWFGNLVTMEWWNDLWLNEGFATFMEYFCASHIFKSWQMMDQFVTDHTQRALTMDSHADSHPIQVTVKDPKEVNAIFDSISYDKGASIIGMLKDYLGAEAFDTGLQNYLNKHSFGNAKSDDLWASLGEATKNKVNVKGLMDTWTLQMGYPVVTLQKDAKNPTKCFVTQKHFLLSENAKPTKTSPFGYKWDVPVTIETPSIMRDVVLFNGSTDSQELACPKSGEWIKLNKQTRGFFRTNYDEENWKLLGQQLAKNHLGFNSSDRANLIDDAFEMAGTDRLKYGIALELTKYFDKEKDYTPWHTLVMSLGYMSSLLEGRPGYPVYEKYILQNIRPLIKELGWKDDGTHLQKYLRGLILGLAVKHNETSAVKEALILFRKFKEGKMKLPANLKGPIYAAGIKYGTEEDWNFLWKRRETTMVATEKRKILYSLSQTMDPKLLSRYLAWSLDNNKIRSQDSTTVIIGVSTNIVGAKLAWDFTLKNWDILYERYSKITFSLSKVIKAVFSSGKSLAEKNQVVEFFKTHKTGTGKRALSQAIESIQNHINWLEKHEKEVVEWFKKHITK